MLRKVGILVWKTVLTANRTILYFLVPALLLAMVTVVVVRYIPGAKMYGLTELCTLAAAHLYFAGGAYAIYKDELITVNVLSEKFEKHELFLNWVGLIKYVISAAICGIYGYWALKYCMGVAIAGQFTSDLHYPRILLVCSLTLGFTLYFTFTVYHLCRQARLLRKDTVRELS